MPEPMVCEACGAEFGCEAASGKCWCFEVQTTPETLESLGKTYKNCLCPDCLKKAASSR